MKKKSSKALTRFLTTSQPEEWIAAWRNQASIHGVSLSEFVGESCNRNIPIAVLAKLPKRAKAGRTAMKKAEK